jgi:hypothetical protein
MANQVSWSAATFSLEPEVCLADFNDMSFEQIVAPSSATHW